MLQIEWPEYAKGGDFPERARAVKAVGAELSAAFRSITVLNNAEGRRAQRDILEGVLAHDPTKLDMLMSSLAVAETAHRETIMTGLEALDHAPDALKTLTNGLLAPSNLALLLPMAVLQEDYLNQGLQPSKLSADLRVTWEEHDVTFTESEGSPDVGHTFTETVYTPSLALTVFYEQQQIAILGTTGIQTTERPVENWLESAWANYHKASFERAIEGKWWKSQPPSFSFQSTADAAQQEAAAAVEELVFTQVFVETTKDFVETTNDFGEEKTVRDNALALTGAKALLDAFCTAAMPRAFAYSDLLVALLRGNQSILDGTAIMRAYATAATPPANRTIHATLKAAGDVRLSALTKSIEAQVTAIEDETFDESHAMIETTLHTLGYASNLVSA